MTNPAHKSDRGNHRPVTVLRNDILQAQAVLHGHDSGAVEVSSDAFCHGLYSHGFGGNNEQVYIVQFGWFDAGQHGGVQIRLAADSQALTIQSIGVILPAHQHLGSNQ